MNHRIHHWLHALYLHRARAAGCNDDSGIGTMKPGAVRRYFTVVGVILVALIGLGSMFEVAEATKKQLEAKGLSVALINPRWIKPLDTGTLEFFARSADASTDEILMAEAIEQQRLIGSRNQIEAVASQMAGRAANFVEP